MGDKIYLNESDLLEKAKSAIGQRIGDWDENNRLDNPSSKGNIGVVMEEGFFGYAPNSRREADFAYLGIELKVTSYKWVNKNTQVSAKERLVLTMIDYHNEIKKVFNESDCYHKLDKILLLLYEYIKGQEKRDFVISNIYLYKFLEMPEEDQKIIIDDWNFIINKIRLGQAHELSEGDTFYLGACTKGANSLVVTSQPYSDIMAMPRAFSLKSTYMTYLLRDKVFNKNMDREMFIKDLNKLKNHSLEELIYLAFVPYQNLTLSEIDLLIENPVTRKGVKSYLSLYVTRMLKVNDGAINRIEEFEKSNIKIKTIRVKKDGTIKESMSFPTFKFKKLVNETWEDSETRELFESNKYLFVIFDEIDDSKLEYRFRKVKLWNMPLSDLDTYVKMVWVATQRILNGELEIEIRNKRFENNFPKISQNPVAHIRPHGQDSEDTYKLPSSCSIKVIGSDGTKNIERFVKEHVFTKQCFWLNKDYVRIIIGR